MNPTQRKAVRTAPDGAPRLARSFDRWVNSLAPSPWLAHTGSHITCLEGRRQPLYTAEERIRRDKSVWTLVQGVLAPIQFLVFAVSCILVWRYLATGHGYEIATASIVLKSILLYTIMITGSVWEKVVFGKWLFARPFFWEDVFSMLVLALQTAYLVMLFNGWGGPREQMLVAIAAYAAYVINATQFILKLREARLEAARETAALGRGGQTA